MLSAPSKGQNSFIRNAFMKFQTIRNHADATTEVLLMRKRSLFKYLPTVACWIVVSTALTALLVSCGKQAEPGPESSAAGENDAVSAQGTAPVEVKPVAATTKPAHSGAADANPEGNDAHSGAADANPEGNDAYSEGNDAKSEAETWEGFVYPPGDRSGDECVIYTERVYYDGKSTPETEKVVYLRAPADAVDVVIPDGVTEIVPSALNFNPNLESVAIPDSVGSIPFNGFADCVKLRRVELPPGIPDIPECAFSNCRELTEIAIPEGVATIGPGAFVSCRKLERVSLPASLKTIERGAFDNCSALKEIAIPDGVIEIADDAFRGCPCEDSVRKLRESRGIGAPQPKGN